jgi:hypothetical protein
MYVELRHKKQLHLTLFEQQRIAVKAHRFKERIMSVRNNAGTKTAPTTTTTPTTTVFPQKNKRFSLGSKVMQRAILKRRDSEQVTNVVSNATKAHDLKLKQVEQESIAARNRLQIRLSKRKSIHHHVSTLVKPPSPKNKQIEGIIVTKHKKGGEMANSLPPLREKIVPIQKNESTGSSIVKKTLSPQIPRSPKKKIAVKIAKQDITSIPIGSAKKLNSLNENDHKWATFYEKNPEKAIESGYTQAHYAAYLRKLEC